MNKPELTKTKHRQGVWPSYQQARSKDASTSWRAGGEEPPAHVHADVCNLLGHISEKGKELKGEETASAAWGHKRDGRVPQSIRSTSKEGAAKKAEHRPQLLEQGNDK